VLRYPRLRKLYARELAPAVMREHKREEIERMRDDYFRLRDSQWSGKGDYDAWVASEINNAKLASFASSQTAKVFPYPGATPSISANGSNNAILWAAENTNPAVLHAFDAGNLASELYNSNQAPGSRDHFGAGNKFITPTIINGKVYVGTTNGVGVFGLTH